MRRNLVLLTMLILAIGVGLVGFAKSDHAGSVPYPLPQDSEFQTEAWPFYYCQTEIEWVEQLTDWEIVDTVSTSCFYYSHTMCYLMYGDLTECYKYRRKSLWRVDIYEVCYVMGIRVSRTLTGQDEYYKYMIDSSYSCPGYFPFCCD